jgi:asparagine synthase (glutamine-hydrolysing)
MCGIVGIWKSPWEEQTSQILGRMQQALAHRGPDDAGNWMNDLVALGHQRLSILDVSPTGHQPMFSEDGRVVVVFNGEIYNFIELRAELMSHYQFSTQSDTEVIIAGYLVWGESFIERLNGMFAFALYDQTKETCFLFRDRLGEKPLYYTKQEGALLFASELRAILASGKIERKLNPIALSEYVRYQTVSFPSTIIEKVSALMPGHYLKCTQSCVEDISYWNFPNQHSLIASREESQQKVKQHLLRSVEWRMRSDVPFGAFLSGGLDSSVLVALMAEMSEQPVHTFSIGFEEQEWDESPIAKKVADRYHTSHTRIELRGSHFLGELENAIQSMDHPSGDGINAYVVAKATKSFGIKMAMSGLGGDEVFGGYPIFKRMKSSQNLRRFIPYSIIPLHWVRAILLMKWNGVQVDRIMEFLTAREGSDATFYQADRVVRSTTSTKALLAQDHVFNGYAFLPWSSWDKQHLYSAISIAEMSSYMTHVLLRDGDQMSMANGLEVRVPFLDHSLIEEVLMMPDEWKTGAYPKQLLIDLMGERIPNEVYQRKKQGFAFPWDQWMRGPLANYCEQGLAILNANEYFKPGVLLQEWKLFLAGSKEMPWNRLWHLVVLGHWIKNNQIDG